jgi:hypothetical protein
MAVDGPRRTRILVPALLLAALLGVLAWQWSPASRERMAGGAANNDSFDTTNTTGTSPAPSPHARHALTAGVAAANLQQTRCQQERIRQLRLERERLRNPQTPDQAIDHALLVWMLSLRSPHGDADDDPAGHELRVARRHWPDSMELAWWSMRTCAESLGCDRDGEWQHLASLDPGNAAVWMLAMEMASRRHDDAAYAQALHRAARAKFYDPRTGTVFLHAQPLLTSLPRPAGCQHPDTIAQLTEMLGHAPDASDFAAVEASSVEFAFGQPAAFGSLSGCGPEAPAMSVARRRDCIALLSRIAAGDTLLEQYIALRYLIPLAGDGPEGMALRERYRRLRWLWTQIPRTDLPADYFTRLWVDGEVAILRAAAIAQHRWPPPSGWLPDDERSRALIVDGRVPPEQH